MLPTTLPKPFPKIDSGKYGRKIARQWKIWKERSPMLYKKLKPARLWSRALLGV